MNEKVLGHFLRYKRNHVDLANYSVDIKRRRRTPGLSRDEVAVMAHVSIDWYTRIEQGRISVTPSANVLADLCRVLNFTRPEIEYVFNLVSAVPPRTEYKEVSDTALNLIDSYHAPAFIMDRNLTLLATNPSFQQLYGDWNLTTLLNRNWVWRTFNSDLFRNALTSWSQYSQYVVAVFRKIYSENPDSKFLLQVFDSVKKDPSFIEVWDTLAVSNFKTQRLLLNNHSVGELYLIENILEIPEVDQYVVFEDAGDQATLNKLQSMMCR